MARRRPQAWLPVLALLTACAAAPAPPPDQALPGHGRDLVWVAPHPGAEIRNSAGLVEVSGRVGFEWLMRADVVIAVDLSASAFLASGIDVDGDGRIGRTHHFAQHGGDRERPVASWTSDPDDTVARAEMEAVGHLIRGLHLADTRIAVLTYSGEAETRVGLGSGAGALAALDEIRVTVDWGGSDLREALRRAGELFRHAPHLEGPERPRVIFLLSDGKPNLPQAPYWAMRAALDEAARLAERRVAICVLGFGKAIVSEEERDGEYAFLEDLARRTGCDLFPIHDPDMLRLDRVPRSDAVVELRMRNHTTGSEGRAVRLLGDGVFDGFLDLAPGENTIEVTARLRDGRVLGVRRRIRYHPPEVAGEAERRATARLLLRLRERSRQLESPVSAGPEEDSVLP